LADRARLGRMKGNAMTRRKKIVLIVVAAAILAPILAIVIVLSRLGTIIKIGFERVGPRVLHVATTLDDATVYPLKGEVTLQGLAIGNPPGYEEPTLFQADLIRVDVRPMALMSKEIHVEEVLVDGARFTVEFKGRKSNIRALLDGLEKDAAGEPAPDEPEAPPSGDGGTRIRVDSVKMTNAQANVATMGSAVKISLPTLELPPIADKDGNGVPPKAIAREILLGVVRPIEDALKVSEAAQAIEEGVRQAGEDAKAAADAARETGDRIGEDVKKTGEELKKTGDDLIKDAKDIFKR